MKFFRRKKHFPKDDINIKNRVLFIHIPKNGGTSISRGLGLNASSHIKASDIVNGGYRKLLEKKFSFGVVRNPYERFLSLYNYARMDVSYYHNNIDPKQGRFGRHDDYFKLKDASLLECAHLLIDGQLKHDKYHNQWLPQYTWLCDLATKDLLIKEYFYLNNLEPLESKLNKILNKKIQITRLNTSPNSSDFDLNRETKEMIKNYYLEDFILFFPELL